jgi:hypothetical protein
MVIGAVTCTDTWYLLSPPLHLLLHALNTWSTTQVASNAGILVDKAVLEIEDALRDNNIYVVRVLSREEASSLGEADLAPTSSKTEKIRDHPSRFAANSKCINAGKRCQQKLPKESKLEITVLNQLQGVLQVSSK